MPDELRLDYRTSGPVFSKREELVLWAKDDGTLHTTDQDGTDTPVGGGGSSSVVSCVIARDGTVDIHDVGDHQIVWDALYDNYIEFNTLTEIPDGLGLDFAFDNTSAAITTTEAGVWSFVYNFTLSNDANWRGSFDTRFGGQKVDPGSNAPTLVAHLLAIPSGSMFTPQFSTANAATADPYDVGGVYLIATRLG